MRSSAWRIIFAASLLACRDPAVTAEHRADYVALVSAPTPDPERDLPRCAAIPDAGLAGDCAMAVASRAGTAEREPARYCPRVPEGAWRDECFFQAAEIERRSADRAGAIAACEQAGAFRDRCLFHLWQEDILKAQQGLDRSARAEVRPGALGGGEPVAPGLGPEQIEAAVALGRPLFAEWEARFGSDWLADHGDLPMGVPMEDRSFRAVFWSRFFQQLYAMDPAPDLAHCARTGDLGSLCEAAVLDVVRRRALDLRHGFRAVCDALPEDPAAAAEAWSEAGVRYVPDPALTGALAEACRRPPPGAPPG